VVAPRVRGLQHPPAAFAKTVIEKYRFSFLEIIGGICRVMPREILKDFRFNELMPMAHGGDATFAEYCLRHTYPMAYVENVIVRHMDSTTGQEQKLPEYFDRKFYESYVPYGV
jgi:hypothetical protein